MRLVTPIILFFLFITKIDSKAQLFEGIITYKVTIISKDSDRYKMFFDTLSYITVKNRNIRTDRRGQLYAPTYFLQIGSTIYHIDSVEEKISEINFKKGNIDYSVQPILKKLKDEKTILGHKCILYEEKGESGKIDRWVCEDFKPENTDRGRYILKDTGIVLSDHFKNNKFEMITTAINIYEGNVDINKVDLPTGYKYSIENIWEKVPDIEKLIK